MRLHRVFSSHHPARRVSALGTAALATVALAACTAADPTAEPGSESGSGPDDDTIIIGTANFPESEIVGQLWATALEEAGFTTEVKSGIGSREVYMKALEAGDVDIVPEYTGNLAQFYSATLEPGANSDEVYASLESVLPEAIAAGKMAPAESKDAYRVTTDLAAERNLKTLSDLAQLDGVVIAANPELAERPYGPQGLGEVYGLDESKVSVHPISDGGGPLTIAALLDGSATVADVYTTSPTLDRDGNEVELVTLEDPNNLIPAQNVVPIYRQDAVPTDALAALDELNADLTTENLVAMNLRNSGDEKAEPSVIARDYFGQ